MRRAREKRRYPPKGLTTEQYLVEYFRLNAPYILFVKTKYIVNGQGVVA